MADIKLGSSAAEVKSFLGLTNTNTDKDQWQDFLRISKDLHLQLNCDPVPWNNLSWEVTSNARAQLQSLCRERDLFSAHPNIEPALTWRFNQLQKKGSKNARKNDSTLLDAESVETATTSADIDDRQQHPAVANLPYDPVRSPR